MSRKDRKDRQAFSVTAFLPHFSDDLFLLGIIVAPAVCALWIKQLCIDLNVRVQDNQGDMTVYFQPSVGRTQLDGRITINLYNIYRSHVRPKTL